MRLSFPVLSVLIWISQWGYYFCKDNSNELLSYSLSPINLWYLTNVEDSLFSIIKDYVSKLDNEPEYFFKRYIADYEDSTIVAFNGWNSTKVSKKRYLIQANPLWAHRMIWRFVTDFPQIKDVLLSSGDSEILKAYGNIVSKSMGWPTQKDLNESMDNLLNIHHIYDLKLSEFTNGIIAGVVTNASLCAIHCFEISKHALRDGKKYTLALEWLKIANRKRLDVSGHPILDYLEERSMSELLENITTEALLIHKVIMYEKQHDAAWNEEQPYHHNLYQYFDKIKSEHKLTTQKKVLQHIYKSKGDGLSTLSLNDIAAFSTLCKGGNLQSEKEKSELYCWYESKINPFWYINPQKMELYSKDPYIFQVYDFVGDEFLKYLETMSIPMMSRSKSFHYEKGYYSNFRTSMSAWLPENDFAPRFPMFSQKIGYLTGLTASWPKAFFSSALQVSSYATGGHFYPHVDGLLPSAEYKTLMEIGDRMATFMLYMDDVEHGGITAFTSVGVAVPPVKGSAIVWYDTLYNGAVDNRTWHGGCPVLIGEKWVVNKWIHSNLNIFKRKCTLNKDE